MTRYRVIIETDFAGSAKVLRDTIRSALQLGDLAKSIPGEIVYVATDLAETAVVSHDGKNVTVG